MQTDDKIGAWYTVTVHQQLISNQGFLERGGHESVTRAGVGEDGEVNPEEEEIKDKRNNNEADNPGDEVLSDTFLHHTSETVDICKEVNTYIVGFPPIQEIPKIDDDSDANGQDGKDAVDLG